MRTLSKVIFILVSLTSIGCQREALDTNAVIKFQVPQANNTFNKAGSVGAMSAMPSNRKACYGVNITGPGIGTSKANLCSPSTGLTAGYVEPGANIELSVPRGSARKIEVFAFLQDVGQNNACSQFNPSMSAAELLNTYRIGSTTVDIQSAVVEVNISMDFPGESNHLASLLTLPSSCTSTAGSPNRPGFGVNGLSGVASSGSVVLYGNVRLSGSGQSASNGSVKLIAQ